MIWAELSSGGLGKLRVLAEKAGEKYYVAKALAEKILGEGFTVLETVKGEALLGMEYEPLYTYMPLDGKRAY